MMRPLDGQGPNPRRRTHPRHHKLNTNHTANRTSGQESKKRLHLPYVSIVIA